MYIAWRRERETVERLLTQRLLLSPFVSQFKRKAYIHWFTSEGMDELEYALERSPSPRHFSSRDD